MKICITSTGNNKDSNADFRFGRCKYFAVYDEQTKELGFIMNSGVDSIQGAGITSAQKVIDMGFEVVVTGNIGPNAMKLLNSANIKVFEFKEGTVDEVLKAYLEKNLNEITNPAPSHFGLGNGNMNKRGRN